MSLFPPFDPDARKRAAAGSAPIPCAHPAAEPRHALGALRRPDGDPHAAEARYELALAAIVIAAVLDGIDGRIARFLKSTSRFGAELDSLADFVNFGVAPALTALCLGPARAQSAGWIAAWSSPSARRSGSPASTSRSTLPGEPAWAGNFFVGVPAPAGAMTVLLPIYL